MNGEKACLDDSGLRPSTLGRTSGEVIEVELDVATMGASRFTFAEATRSQKRDDFIASTARAFEYFGGVPEIPVPDQLRSAVSGPDRLDPPRPRDQPAVRRRLDLRFGPVGCPQWILARIVEGLRLGALGVHPQPPAATCVLRRRDCRGPHGRLREAEFFPDEVFRGDRRGLSRGPPR